MIDRLTESLTAAGIPIDGVDRPRLDSTTVDVNYRASATAQQIQQGQQIVASFDWSEAAHRAWLEAKNPERQSLRSTVAQVIQDNNAFLADTNVTTSELIAQAKALTRQMNAVIRRLAQID